MWISLYKPQIVVTIKVIIEPTSLKIFKKNFIYMTVLGLS